jgi:hypothetical protein
VFFEKYISIQNLIYTKIDLPLNIETPEQPFWIECDSRYLPDVPVNTESILEHELEEYLKNLKK